MLKLLAKWKPPAEWRLPVLIVLAVLAGLGFTVLKISNAHSYLSDSPSACVNCHVMSSAYATWQRGSHGRVAVCNDCHVPQDFFRRYLFKAQDGLRHATMFTLRLEPQVLRIKSAGEAVVQENCVRCHSNFLERLSDREAPGTTRHDKAVRCWDCHRETPHGRVNSLSSTPYARVPRLSPTIPEWMNKLIQTNRETKP